MDKVFFGEIVEIGIDPERGLRVLLPKDRDSLLHWGELYFVTQVKGGAGKTVQAKRADLVKFFSFFRDILGHDRVDGWSPAVTKGFQSHLRNSKSQNGGGNLKATTINRIFATVRHFGRWVDNERPLMAGDPFNGVRDIGLDVPDWNGLSMKEVMRLKGACEQRLKSCIRGNQDPLLEMAVFLVLLNTGMREFELCSLNVEQYQARGFHQVVRKGNRVTRKIPVPSEAREVLDEYLEKRGNPEGGPLFVSRYGNRLATQDAARICNRIASQASAHLKSPIKLTPHMLRHTFLKKVADKFGVHVAQELSGNVSFKEIFRYTRPSEREMEESVEGMFR